ncbi:hypothetical protein M2105_005700 [Paenibacillus sp. PastF-1]|nr:hypothetical protein [Paenibacillus sp. PastF-2]MDF9851205.1 hypothetical protein [Paenibacillus sp. PastM-2]MDF9857802.1 hypothetical protein [Paenibacillus sp. PastF-1]MDH6483054.1 hypothetical protein [Paenibacillus sp. PastH-2]MDH6510482.1 hypothetical protein [Paenibacillus sp. PastM-3]
MYHHLIGEPVSLDPGVLTAGQFDEYMQLLKQKVFRLLR